MQNSGMENGQNLTNADSRVKVLVVDDHPNTANMLARAISRLGSHVDVASATSGLEALQHVENGATDILITDMMMPEMNGLELIEKLNEEPYIRPVFSFLVTAYDSAEFVETAEYLNVKRIITKPVHPESICEIVSQAIDEMEQSRLDNSVDAVLASENSELDLPGDGIKMNTTSTSQIAARELGQNQTTVALEASALGGNGNTSGNK